MYRGFFLSPFSVIASHSSAPARKVVDAKKLAALADKNWDLEVVVRWLIASDWRIDRHLPSVADAAALRRGDLFGGDKLLGCFDDIACGRCFESEEWEVSKECLQAI